MSEAPILALSDITKSFGGLTALKGISLTVPRGEICGIIGPNGAGKSTLLSIISGSVISDKGRVVFDQKDVTSMPMHRRARLGLARTFQLAHTFETLSVKENILIGAEDHAHLNIAGAMSGIGAAAALAWERAERVMELMGVSAIADITAAQLTFGQQRMVATARALAANPLLLLLDEPAAGLSGKDIEALSGAIRKIRDSGTTVIIVEHNMDVIMQLCEHIVVIHLGEKISDGIPADVRQSERVLEAYLGT